MIINTDTTLAIARPLDTRELWCVFEHWMNTSDDPMQPPSIIYVAACRLNDVFTLGVAKNNTEWSNLTKDNERGIMVRIVMIGDDHSEIHAQAIQHLHRFNPMPRCNLHGTSKGKLRRVILCSNGKSYPTQAHAARDLGISQGAISSNLKGTVKTVNGYTFTYKDN